MNDDRTGDTIRKPWGSYTVLSDEADHKVKRIRVRPGCRLSLQSHEKRSEHWYGISGEGIVQLDESQVAITAGTAVDIPLGVRHRVSNPGGGADLVFIEVQTGSYFGEDDIQRYEDDYGRA